MATDKDIGDIVKKCKILLLDIEGTTTSISFVKDKLFPYAEENVKQFLDSQWESEDVKDAVTSLRKLAIEDQESSVEGVVAIPGEDASKEEQIEGLVKSVKWQMSADRKAGALKQLQGLIWKQGYDNGDIKGHVYDDVSAALESWHSTEGHKIYIYSSGSVQAQKLLFGQSLAGDLLKFIDGHFDTAVGAKQEAQSYKNIVEKIGCQPDEILFLTDIVKEAEAARSAGVHAALVSREGNAPLCADDAASYPVLRSLSELTVSNKRKPDTQEETPAAKVPKTGADEDVKAAAATATPAAVETEPQPEKMEVEETVAEEPKPAPVKEQVIVEEITDSNEGSSVVSAVDLEPVVVDEESMEGKETKSTPPQKEVPVEEKKKEMDGPVAEETPPAPTVLTEVEEVTDDKPMPDVEEMVEDVVPIVEEPEVSEEMEELKNVGDVLEKECDEILSKVNKVTDIDNITVKPLLDPVPEETMETENTDSNDIVDRILDTELDLEMKQCSDIDLNTVTEMGEEKTNGAENGLKDASPAEVTTTVSDDAAKETVPEKVSEKVQESSSEAEQIKPEEAETHKTVAAKDTAEAEVVNTDTALVTEPENTATSVETKEAEPAPEVTKNNENITQAIATEEKPTGTETAVEATEVTAVAEESKHEETSKESTESETQMNGKSTNGDPKTLVNGDANKEEELNARLTVDGAEENGKVNGSNGNGVEEKGQGDCKIEEIKVKTAAEEPRTDPTEQPTEA